MPAPPASQPIRTPRPMHSTSTPRRRPPAPAGSNEDGEATGISRVRIPEETGKLVTHRLPTSMRFPPDFVSVPIIPDRPLVPGTRRVPGTAFSQHDAEHTTERFDAPRRDVVEARACKDALSGPGAVDVDADLREEGRAVVAQLERAGAQRLDHE